MKQRINSKIYNIQYFDSERCEGFYEYKKNDLSPLKKIEISLLDIRKNDKILDIGCGRGDIPNFLSHRNFNIWAIDYSADAVEITKKRVSDSYRKQIFLHDARKQLRLKIKFNKIIIGDVIEHMTFKDALKVINNAYSELDDRGVLVIHTAPNVWFKKYIYPIIRIAFSVIKFENVRHRLDENIKNTHEYHINEYSYLTLLKLMKRTKFKNFKVWINRDAVRESSSNYLNPIKKSKVFKLYIRFINSSPLIYFFGNDLLVMAKK